MNHDEMSKGLQDALSVRRVVGDPVERDGVTVIPVAAVRGGWGGGGGTSGGAGFGLRSRGVGVYVVKDGEVRFEPAVDVTRIALAGLAAGALVAYLFRPRR
ncbi:MAG: sporulation protein [Gaiellaceae bacterium]